MDERPLLDPKITRVMPRFFRAVQRSVIRFGARVPAGSDPRIYDLRPWYHDFTELGLNTDFTDSPSLGEGFANSVRRALGKEVLTTRGTHATQKIRDAWILPHLEKAFLLHRERFGNPESFLDTFANDGFYGFWVAKHCGVSRVTCIELNSQDVKRGQTAAEVLGMPQVKFLCQDIHAMDDAPADVALCMGGLYHIADPQAVVDQLRAKANVLVVQSCTTTLSNDPSFFLTPAPGWHHGSRFSHEYFLAMLERAGWEILESERTVVPKADDKHSFGLSQALCARR